ncbi:MAG: glycosyltransferase family 4 protein [Planctomycetota bacterium]
MKRRILCILQLPPPVHGAAIMGLSIKKSKELREAFDWDFVNLSTSRSMDEVGCWTIRKLITFLSILRRVLGKLLRNRYDLCYIALAATGSPFYKDSIVVGLVKLFRVRVVYHMHNKGVNSRQHRWLDNRLYRRVFASSSVILLSRRLYADVQEYVRPARAYFCPNGIRHAGSNIPCRPDENTPVEILFLSNMVESKGVFVLLDACRELKKRGYSFVCKFIGATSDVTEDRFYARVSQNQLAGYVSYEGVKYGSDKDHSLAFADIFALPTYYHYECFPLVLLEAMQFGLPVVSTHEGGIPDIVEDGRTGYLCPQRDAIALGDKLEILIRDASLRRRMGAAGYQKYKNEFTLERFEKCLKDILSLLTEASISDSKSNTTANA